MTTYRDAGVDIAAGEETVRRIKGLVRQTFTPGVLTDIGAFGGFFALDTAAYREPVLVSSIDGVGTKLKVAVRAGRHDTVGQDLVNHCVNDIAVCGARPLFFLDYFGDRHGSSPTWPSRSCSGFATACKANGCALIGGETAEMPGIYSDGDYDLAGSIVGVVERDGIDRRTPRRGGRCAPRAAVDRASHERLLARPRRSSSSISRWRTGRTNSAARRSARRSSASTARTSTRSRRSCADDLAHGFAHITGGGLEGNTRRILPDGLGLAVDWDAWERPAIFQLIRRLGEVPEEDMRSTFNLGVGLVAVVPEAHVAAAKAVWAEMGEHAHRTRPDRRLAAPFSFARPTICPYA